MNYRNTKMLAEKTMAGSGTEVIEVKVKDIISRITIAWRVTMAGYGMDSYCHRDITKIELVDGSDVLFSLDGGQAQALCMYDRKTPTMNHGQYLGGNSAYSTYGIDFGRFLNDPELALDPKRFENLQLKISYNVALMDTGASTAYLEVWADVFDEKLVSPQGFLMSKEIHSRTPPSSGYWDVGLPTDYPYRKMLIQGYRAKFEPWNQVIEARLDEDNQKRVPFDWDLEDYYRVMKGLWTPVEDPVYARGDPAADYSLYLTPTDYYAAFVGTPIGNGLALNLRALCKGGYCDIDTETAASVLGVARGYLPNHCFEFPLGDPKDIADWYDVTNIGSLNLRLKAGAGLANGTVAVVVQQLRS